MRAAAAQSVIPIAIGQGVPFCSEPTTCAASGGDAHLQEAAQPRGGAGEPAGRR